MPSDRDRERAAEIAGRHFKPMTDHARWDNLRDDIERGFAAIRAEQRAEDMKAAKGDWWAVSGIIRDAFPDRWEKSEEMFAESEAIANRIVDRIAAAIESGGGQDG